MTLQVATGTFADGAHKLFQFGMVGRFHTLKARLAVSAGIHAIEQQHMQSEY